MNISKFTRFSVSNYLSKSRYAQVAAAKPSTDAEIGTLPKQATQVSKTPSGISVISTENYSPVSHLSVLIKAGSRYENGLNRGISHCLRNCSSLSSAHRTAFAITRHIEEFGGKLWVTSTREHMMYTLQCNRDEFDLAIELLSEVASQHVFKPWEVSDATPRMTVDRAIHEQNPDSVLMELLHQAAFRGGLNNSLYCPAFMIGKHDSEMLHNFVKEHYTAPRTTAVGFGIDHEYFSAAVQKLFDMKILSGDVGKESRFGGGEIRVETNLPHTHTAIVAEGASLTNTKEMLSLAVLQCILGLGPRMKHTGSEHSKLGAAAAKAATSPFSVSALNINYSDIGMFGVHIVGNPKDMQQMVKAVVTGMREATKSITDEDVKIAKNILKTKICLERDSVSDQGEDMLVQFATTGVLKTPEELQKDVDAITTTDVSTVASKVMKTKPAIASLGPLDHMPYLDELI